MKTIGLDTYVLAALLTLVGGADIRAAGASPSGENVVTAWNEIAYEIAYAEDSFFTFKGHRAFSMMHLAVHDALNTITPRYTRYACTGSQADADPTAAAAQAAHQVLVTQYPDRRSKLDSTLSRWLEPVPADARKARGVAVGRACAAAILELREDDGWDFAGSYEFTDAAGRYQTTGTLDGFMLQPGFRHARPFALISPSQFRPPPPPAISSEEYAQAYEEVKRQGGLNSAARNEDQTGYAVWWMEFAEGSINRLARELVSENDTDLWDSARLFAYLNVALYDGYIAVWDSKYEYDHWRPETAVKLAATDGNPATSPDPNWKPLRPTPPFQDYASAHAEACAASLGVLALHFGDAYSFTMTTNTAPEGMPTRSFSSFGQAAEECADSRIQLGWHFRYAADDGLVLGRRVLEYIVSNYLLARSPITRPQQRR